MKRGGGLYRRLTGKMIGQSAAGRGRFRAGLSLATGALVLVTLPFLPREHWPDSRAAVMLAACAALLALAALIRPLHRVWDRVGGIVGISMITLLAYFTGGSNSPYTILYLISLLYGAIFHERSRLIAESIALLASVSGLLLVTDDVVHRDVFVASIRLGALLIMGAVVHDLVAQLRRTARKLESSEQKYRSLVEYNPDAVHTFDLQARFTSANPAAATLSGYTPEELREMRQLPLTALLAPDRIEETLAGFRATAEGRPQHFDTTILDRYGRRIDLQVATVPIVVDGEVVGVYSVSKDITDRKLAERLLRERAAQQAAVGRLGQSALVIADQHALLDEAARLVAETIRAPLAGVFELRGSSQAVLLAGTGWRPGAVGVAIVPVAAPYDTGLAVTSTAPVVASDYLLADEGRPVPLVEDHRAGSGMTVVIRTGDWVFGMLGVYDAQPREFTDDERTFVQTVANVLASAISRRRAEQQLLQAQKLQAVGQLAGGIAHDFNNLLTAVIGYCELLEPHLHDDLVGKAHLNEALAAGERARALVDQILTFSRGRVTSATSCRLNEVIDGMAGLLRRLLPPEVELRLDLGEGIGAVRAEQTQLEQVVLNLVVNARDAMPAGGRLRVATTEVDLDGTGGEPLGLRAGRYAALVVEDSGTGMDAATAARLFEPFFTTKAPGRGTGLGLSTVYGIVTGAGGQVLVESQPGRGSTFSVYLPVHAEEHVPAPRPVPAVPAPHHGGDVATILVVEDQAAVRSLVCEILQQRGHAVLQAANGLEAREVAAGHGGPVDLLITDVVMPQLGGPELAALLRTNWPGLRVLYMSGYSAKPELLQGADHAAAFLAKPFGAADLVRHIDEMLARREPAAHT